MKHLAPLREPTIEEYATELARSVLSHHPFTANLSAESTEALVAQLGRELRPYLEYMQAQRGLAGSMLEIKEEIELGFKSDVNNPHKQAIVHMLERMQDPNLSFAYRAIANRASSKERNWGEAEGWQGHDFGQDPLVMALAKVLASEESDLRKIGLSIEIYLYNIFKSTDSSKYLVSALGGANKELVHFLREFYLNYPRPFAFQSSEGRLWKWSQNHINAVTGQPSEKLLRDIDRFFSNSFGERGHVANICSLILKGSGDGAIKLGQFSELFHLLKPIDKGSLQRITDPALVGWLKKNFPSAISRTPPALGGLIDRVRDALK